MKVRTLIVSILGALVVSSVSLAQDAAVPEQEPREPAFTQSDSPTPAQPEPSFVAQTTSAPVPQAPGPRQQNATLVARTPPLITPTPASTPTELRIFELKHASAVDMSNLISSILGVQVVIDGRLNRLIVSATKEQMQGVENLIVAMDVESPEASTSRDVQDLVYRVYMFEIPSKDKGNKSFSMILQTSAQLPSTKLLGAAAEKGIQISDFLVSNEEHDESGQQVEFLIQGKAPSNESINQMVEGIAESRIKELKWDDATFTSGIEAAHYSRLPEQMQKHIKKFLGEDIETVGYWFGSSSVPGETEAPIGPWILRLGLNAESDRELELRVEVKEPENSYDFSGRLGRVRSNEILSNTIRAKDGKPIIIGYNRESYGTRKMGAMVIVPEADIIQLETNYQ